MIEGVLVHPLKIIADQRGAVMHMLKKTDPHFEEFGEIYFSVVQPGAVKGWNKHKKMVLNLAAVSGNIKLVIFDAREGSSTKGEISELIIGEDNYCLVKIPPGLWVGFKATGKTPAILANCASLPHDPQEKEHLDILSERIPYKWE